MIYTKELLLATGAARSIRREEGNGGTDTLHTASFTSLFYLTVFRAVELSA